MFLLIRNQSSSLSKSSGPRSPTKRITARVTVVTPCCQKPLAGVSIHVDGREHGQTNKDGVLELPLPTGRHIVAAPAHSNDAGTIVDIEPGKPVQNVSLAVGSELYLFLTDFSYDDTFKDAVMLCTSLSNISDEADSFIGTATAPGCVAPELDPDRDVAKNFYPVSTVLGGTSCHQALKSLVVSDADGRNFEPNEDLLEWYEVFENECLIDVLFTGTPLRWGLLLGKRAIRARADDKEIAVIRPADKIRIKALEPVFTPASWDIRDKPPLTLPRLTHASMWRPSCDGRRLPSLGATMPVPDPRLQKPRFRPSRGALGELDLRLTSLASLFEKDKPPVKMMPIGFAERLKKLAAPSPHKLHHSMVPSGEISDGFKGSQSAASLLPKRKPELWVPGKSEGDLQSRMPKSTGDLHKPHNKAPKPARDKKTNTKPEKAASPRGNGPERAAEQNESVFSDKSDAGPEVHRPEVDERHDAGGDDAQVDAHEIGDASVAAEPLAIEQPSVERNATNASEDFEFEGDTSNVPPDSAVKAVTYGSDMFEDADPDSPTAGNQPDGVKPSMTYGSDMFEDADPDSPAAGSQPDGVKPSMTYGSDMFETEGGDDNAGSLGDEQPSVMKSQTYASDGFDDYGSEGGDQQDIGGDRQSPEGGDKPDDTFGAFEDDEGAFPTAAPERKTSADEFEADDDDVASPSQAKGDDFEREAEGAKTSGNDDEFEDDDDAGTHASPVSPATNARADADEFEDDDDAGTHASPVSPATDARADATADGFDDFEEDEDPGSQPKDSAEQEEASPTRHEPGDNFEDAFEEDDQDQTVGQDAFEEDDEESPPRGQTADTFVSATSGDEFEESESSPDSQPKKKANNDSVQSDDYDNEFAE